MSGLFYIIGNVSQYASSIGRKISSKDAVFTALGEGIFFDKIRLCSNTA
jgi:hypothetical protein